MPLEVQRYSANPVARIVIEQSGKTLKAADVRAAPLRSIGTATSFAFDRTFQHQTHAFDPSVLYFDFIFRPPTLEIHFVVVAICTRSAAPADSALQLEPQPTPLVVSSCPAPRDRLAAGS